MEEDPTGGKFSAAGGTLNSAPHKLEDAVHFHVGDIVKALGRAALQPGGQEALLYGTLGGAIGAPPPPAMCLRCIWRCCACDGIVSSARRMHCGMRCSHPL